MRLQISYRLIPPPRLLILQFLQPIPVYSILLAY